MSQRVYLHIGLQKTGTSYLQMVFWASTAELASQGLAMVPPSKRETFWLMLDVRGRYRPESDPPQAGTAVARLPEQLRSATAPRALITEESLASSTEEQVERLLRACEGQEVHVVLTVRDIARQIPSSWQQSVQMGNDKPLAHYVERLRRTEGTGHPVWRQLDVPAVLGRWVKHVPAERIHVVTVPPPGGDPTELLRRYCRALEIDVALLAPPEQTRGNRALRQEQAEVLRRVNALLPAELKTRHVYGDHGKRYLAVKILGSDKGTRIVLPEQHRDWCERLADREIEHLRSGGYDVIGDLDDLRPRVFGPEVHVDEESVASVATQAIADMLADRMRTAKQGRRAAAPERGLLARLRRRLRG